MLIVPFDCQTNWKKTKFFILHLSTIICDNLKWMKKTAILWQKSRNENIKLSKTKTRYPFPFQEHRWMRKRCAIMKTIVFFWRIRVSKHASTLKRHIYLRSTYVLKQSRNRSVKWLKKAFSEMKMRKQEAHTHTTIACTRIRRVTTMNDKNGAPPIKFRLINGLTLNDNSALRRVYTMCDGMCECMSY